MKKSDVNSQQIFITYALHLAPTSFLCLVVDAYKDNSDKKQGSNISVTASDFCEIFHYEWRCRVILSWVFQSMCLSNV